MPDKKLFEGRFISVVEDEAGYERAYLCPAVHVIPFVDDDHILMIKEHRKIEGRTRWKFVAGFRDKPGLTPEQIAQEELMEEAGYSAERLVPYYHHERAHSFVIPITFFLAYGLKEDAKPNPDGDVIEDVQVFHIEELYRRALEGEFDFLHEHSMIMKVYRDWKAGTLHKN